ncbi:stage II sporulation protein D [Mangrovibacillus cuniculi]|uniref:Stage II sporulation protein D n=1 Tax=Mangrovibacillus cuniculi TaxID=2593652 RepID=A0A7S8CD31_9BACI|nr:stage II sporulation protein D [Mangrovibacillus cuniculi]QPC47697.1 stage II sporulation protein D [Mangrovibacillus cuniculi]
MNQWKWTIGVVVIFVLGAFIVPSLLVTGFSADEEVTNAYLTEAEEKETASLLSWIEDTPNVSVSVYRAAEETVEDIPLEEYVVGVVASEMPAEFEKEALKAQALAARTYIVRQLSVDDPSVPNDAAVTDTVQHQVYKDRKQLKIQWKENYQTNLTKVVEAVKETNGQILTYNGELITASFFSTSNGKTENAEAYWENPFPYLVSVDSPWDKESPKFEQRVVLPIEEFENKLGVRLKDPSKIGIITKRTPGERVAEVKIEDNIFTGREIREKLELASSDFDWVRKGNDVVITTKGYGHGVGMSQYGANGMAKSGKKVEEIIQYYYKGVEVTSAESFLKKAI